MPNSLGESFECKSNGSDAKSESYIYGRGGLLIHWFSSEEISEAVVLGVWDLSKVEALPPPSILNRFENFDGVFGTSSSTAAAVTGCTYGSFYLILRTLLGSILVDVYCLFGSTVIDYLIVILSLLTLLVVVIASSTTTPLIDLNIVENSLNEATLLAHTTDTIMIY